MRMGHSRWSMMLKIVHLMCYFKQCWYKKKNFESRKIIRMQLKVLKVSAFTQHRKKSNVVTT